MRNQDIPAYMTEVRETLSNHFDLGVVVMCFKQDPNDPRSILSTGSMGCTFEAIEAGIESLTKARNAMIDEALKRGIEHDTIAAIRRDTTADGRPRKKGIKKVLRSWLRPNRF